MKNKFLIFLLLCCFINIPLKAQNLKITQITNDVIVLHIGFVKVTAIRTDSGIVITDSFLELDDAKAGRKMIQNYFPGLPVKYLINTHHHSDHVRGNQYFNDAVIIGHKKMVKYVMAEHKRLLKKYKNYDEKITDLKTRIQKVNDSDLEKLKKELANWEEAKIFLEKYTPTPPAIQITSDIDIHLGGKTFEILHFGPAHTTNDIVILDKVDRVLIMGDLLCYKKCYVMNSESDILNWMSLLEKLLERAAEYDHVISGHGGISFGADALIVQKEYLENVYAKVSNAREKGLTLTEAQKELQFEEYKEYMQYNRMALDIEALWQQLDKKENQ